MCSTGRDEHELTEHADVGRSDNDPELEGLEAVHCLIKLAEFDVLIVASEHRLT